jgi:Cd2+/Zn2+-exporting ATPase
MKKRIIRLTAGGLLFAAGLIIPQQFRIVKIALYAAAYLLCGADVLAGAAGNLFRGSFFDENFLMALASIGAVAIGAYPEAAAVMLFYQVGETFQAYAVGKSRRSIADLMDIRPDSANVLRGGQTVTVPPEDVQPGEEIVVRAGERIPLDGVVKSGSAAIDTSALTGESMPRDVSEGGDVLSGCINLSGLITVEVTKCFSESTVSRARPR